MFVLLFWQERQPVSSQFHIPTGFAHRSIHIGGLRGLLTDRETVYLPSTAVHSGKENNCFVFLLDKESLCVSHAYVTDVFQTWQNIPYSKALYELSHASQLINSLRAKLFRGNINMYLHFMSFLHTDMP